MEAGDSLIYSKREGLLGPWSKRLSGAEDRGISGERGQPLEEGGVRAPGRQPEEFKIRSPPPLRLFRR